MTKGFKVIKEFAAANKGDVLTYNEDSKLYEFYFEDDKSVRSMFIDGDTANEFVQSGYLKEIELKDEEDTALDKLCKLSDLVDTLEAQYEKDHEEIVNAYNEQEIPTCVKVEADTVYFNMNQILKKVKEIINE